MTAPTPERIDEVARDFHDTYEALASGFGYSTRRDSAVEWEGVPAANKELMRATVASMLHRGMIR